MTRTVREPLLRRPREEIRGEGDVVLERAHAACEHRLSSSLYDGGERHLETVDAAVVGELLFHGRPPAAPAGAS